MSASVVSAILGLGLAFGCVSLVCLIGSLPPEDRAWLDRPPIGYRMIWLLVRLGESCARAALSANRRQNIERKLRHAGAEFRLSAEQFLAGKVLAVPISLLAFSPILATSIPAAPLLLAGAAVLAWLYPDMWLHESSQRRQRDLLHALPFTLDIITLSVEAGNNLTGGLAQAVQRAPDSVLRSELLRVLRDVRAGRTRAEALRDMAERSGSTQINQIIGGLIQAERSGASLGSLLREQARQLRQERFRLAEKQAMEAPVKLLGPLLLFIFPTTFLVLGFLVLSKAMQEQLIDWAPLVWAYHWPG